MLIESLIRRTKGTETTMGDKSYHFKPTDTDERHIAEVKDGEHIERFLSIKEGYAEAKSKGKPAAKEPVNTAPIADLLTGAEISNETAPDDAAKESIKADLVAQAKELGIKSPHLYSAEKLQAKIAEAQAE